MPTLPLDASVFLLLFARVGAVLMLLPVFAEESVPARIRLLLALGMSAGLWGMLEPRIAPALGDGAALAGLVIAEMLVGLAMGMIIRIMFAAASMAGSLIASQVGLAAAMMFDPTQSSQAPLLSRFVGIAAALVCFGIGVHHLWIGAMVHSYALFPVGGLPPAQDFATLAVSVTGNATALALSLSAPLIVYGIAFNAALGLSARMAPAIQVFFIAQPLNIMLGIALFATVIGALLATFAATMSEWTLTSWT